MFLPHGEPKAYVERNFLADSVTIRLAIRAGNGSLFVLNGDGTIREYQPNDPALYTTPEPGRPYLELPENLARQLLDALAAFFGGVSEARTLRKDYDAERARVDRLIEYLNRAFYRDGK